MDSPEEGHRVGIEYVHTVTALLRRVRNAHPTNGLFEAADISFWWARARPTDSIAQLFWFDDAGEPIAAMPATAWGDAITLDPIVLPDADPEWVAHVIARGLANARTLGFTDVEIMIDTADDTKRDILASHGFAATTDGDALAPDVESWISSDALPDVRPIADGYRLASRLETMDEPHHFVKRYAADVEARLQQTPLYRPDLDLIALDADGTVAAEGMFWFDPETGTGLVEPMATDETHRQKGLARHILTSGLHRLAAAGAARTKIVFDPNNGQAKHIYTDVGFVPVKETTILTGTLG